MAVDKNGFDWDYFVPVKLGTGLSYLAPKGIEVGDEVDVTMKFSGGRRERHTTRTVGEVGPFADKSSEKVDAAVREARGEPTLPSQS